MSDSFDSVCAKSGRSLNVKIWRIFHFCLKLRSKNETACRIPRGTDDVTAWRHRFQLLRRFSASMQHRNVENIAYARSQGPGQISLFVSTVLRKAIPEKTMLFNCSILWRCLESAFGQIASEHSTFHMNLKLSRGKSNHRRLLKFGYMVDIMFLKNDNYLYEKIFSLRFRVGV